MPSKKMKFGDVTLEEKEAEIVNDAPLKESWKAKRKRTRVLSYMVTEEEFAKIEAFLEKYEYGKSEFLRRAMRHEMRRVVEEKEKQSTDPVWRGEPMFVSEAAERWGIAPTTIRQAIRGGMGYPPRFRWNEVKQIPGKERNQFLVIRSGMERLFGEEKNPPEKPALGLFDDE